MASVDAVNYPAPLPQPLSSHSHGSSGIKVEDLNHIDISLLSQSELQALSLFSDSAFNVRRTDDVVSPQLNRSVFNESAGSRRQTYSRLHHRSHSRLPRSLKPQSDPHSSSDPVSHSIVHFLKHFLNGEYNPPPPPPLPPLPRQETSGALVDPLVDVGFLGLQDDLKFKRRRARKGNKSKAKVLENGVGIELQLVNSKGEMVNLAELEEKGDELYSEELKRRTVGLETEEGVLGFLWDLEGQWCSRRNKRKYVDASVFGDALPIGWKVLLGLRRREYRVSVYCRRFISPTGQQFMTCKEAASFLKSYFGGNDADQQRDQKTCTLQHAYALSSGKSACPTDKMDAITHDVAHSTMPRNSSNLDDDCFMGIENLPEVQVRDIFECFKCNLTFDEKNVYLEHLFSFHQKTTKRYKFGTPVGEGVIIKDGKYECQFCHKVFEERHSYNGHVVIHARNCGKSSNELAATGDVSINAESPLQEGVSARSSKMDALIEIAQNSIFETSTLGTSEQVITNQFAGLLRVEEAQANSTCHDTRLSSDPVEIQAEDSSADRTLSKDVNPGSIVMRENNDIVRDDNVGDLNVRMDPSCMYDSDPVGSGEIQKHENNSLSVGYGNRCLKPSGDHLEDTPELTVGEIVFQDGVSSVPLTQSFQLFPPFDSPSDKGEHEFSVVAQNLEDVTAFEDLRFDDMEPFKYGFVNGQELPAGSMNLGNESGIDDGFNTSVGFGSEEVMLDTSQLTVCVWCRAEFKLEGFESETLPDSIGYMCPTCKAKISGHFGGGLSMDPDGF